MGGQEEEDDEIDMTILPRVTCWTNFAFTDRVVGGDSPVSTGDNQQVIEY